MSLLMSAVSSAAASPSQATENGIVGTGSPSVVRQITLPQRSSTVPQLTASQRTSLDAATARSYRPDAPIPQDPTATVRQGSPLAPPAVPQSQAAIGTAAATDLVAFKSVPLGIAGQGGSTSTTDEPSVASNGNTVFYTGNWYAAVSTDAGSSVTYLNPYADFPSNYGGFCCDQVTIYDPSRNITIWELQYVTDASGNNAQRFAIATGQAGVADNSWRYFDITATQLGFPTGTELDYPHLALGANYLYATTNAYNISGAGIGSAIYRMPLDILASVPSGGTVSPGYYAITGGAATFTPVSEAGTTMYLARHSSATSVRFYTWTDTPGQGPTYIDVAHSAFPGTGQGSHHCVAPDGDDMCAFDDERIKTGWLSGGVAGFMWDAGQGTGGLGTFPYPYVHAVRINVATGTLVDEPIIWSSTTAWGFPGAGVNGRGAIGGSIAFGGGGYYPGSDMFVRDDVSPNAWQLLLVRYGTNGPGRNRWGDFLTARPASGGGDSWIGTSFTQQGPCTSTTTSYCTSVEPRFVWFGRVRDNPFGPVTTSLSPNSAFAGGPGLTVTVTGLNFVPGSTVLWNGTPRATVFVSPTEVQATITASDIANPGAASVAVQNPDGTVSNPSLVFAITVPPNPIPRPGPPPSGTPSAVPIGRGGPIEPGTPGLIPGSR